MHWLVMTLLFTASPTSTESWPGFRGDGSSRTPAQNLPLRWSGKENIAWTTTLPGYGQSSPVVWRERVFVTAVEGVNKEKCFVAALDAATGKQLWRHEFPASQPGKNNPSTSRAAPTPVVDVNGVYAFFESGDVIALDHAGKALWQRNLVKDLGELKNNHGLGSSPAQTDKAVIVLVEHAGPSCLLAIDKATGKDLWKTERTSRRSWASPIVVQQDGRELVLVRTAGDLMAYEAATGKELWTHGGLTGNLIPSPTAGEGVVVLGAGESGRDPNAEQSAKSNCCVRLVEKDGKPACEVVWQGQKAIAHHASPLVHQGHAYIVTKPGIVYCLDLKTGEERYSQRLDNPCWATPVGAGDHVYFFGKEGVTTVLKAGPKMEKVASNRLWTEADLVARREAAKKSTEDQFPMLPDGPARKSMEAMLADATGDVVYGVAVVNGTIFLRTGRELYCIRQAK